MWQVLIILAAGFVTISTASPADVIYRGREARGVMYYSDTPPGEGARDVKMLRIPGQRENRSSNTAVGRASTPGARAAGGDGGRSTSTGGTTDSGGVLSGAAARDVTSVGGGASTAGRTNAPKGGGTTAIRFSSTLDEFPNPERGLSRMYSNLAGLPSSWLAAHRAAGYRLVTHRQSLANYVDTPTLPESFLTALNAGAALHRATGTKMVMQFSYWDTPGAREPTLTTILGHIKQLAPFWATNADVIVAIHGGFLGIYGEWAESYEPSVGIGAPSAAAKVAVRDALFAVVPATIPIGWRLVPDLMAWYPTPLNASQAFTGTNQARSGIHNDCFLRDQNDAGTYWAKGVSPTGRTPADNQFRAYHASMSNWTTTGGENCSGGQYTACADVLYDGPTYHWRYLRDDWGTVFHDGWKAQGCYPRIKRSLGYRFRLDSISHPQSAARGDTVNVEINLRNVGWARIFSARKLVVTLKNTTTGALISGSAGDMRLLPPQAASSTRAVVAVTIPAGASPGDYAVYVSMPDIWPGTKDKADFAVRFANADDPAKAQAWEAANFRFRTGTTLSVQ
jgi:hypothetical protein